MSDYPPPKRNASYEKAPWVSEIKDKGDLFYVEQYVDVSNMGHSIGEHKQTTYQQNGGQVTKDKRVGGNRFLDLLSPMKKTKKTPDITSLQQNDHDKQQDVMNVERDAKIEVKLRVDPPRIGPYKRDDLQSVLGIIPRKYSAANDRDELYMDYRDSKIIIAGFTPTGPAHASNELEIGDIILALNGLEINTNNINAMLRAIPGGKPVEVTLKIQKHPPPLSQFAVNNGFIQNDNHLLKPIGGRRDSEKMNELQDIPHAIMFLSLDISSEDEVEKDILFQFPKESFQKSIFPLRGIFLTLGDLLTTLTGSSPRSTSVVIEERLIHIGYQKCKQEILVLALPASRVTLLHLNILMENLNRLLCMMFGSLHRAFCDDCNTLRLECFFSLIFEYILGTKSLFADSNKNIDPLDGFINCIDAARWLDLPSKSKVDIDTCLNEIEANDCEWATESFTMRRQYLVLGSCLFYKGVLVGNHLPTEDLKDIVLYCRFHCLFTTSEQQRLAQLVIWREVFLTKKNNDNSENSESISNCEPRTFLLIVGLKHFLFAIILEAGVISQRANGNPGPDPYYIDQAKNILIELEDLEIPAACEDRIQNPSTPPTVTADQSPVRSKSAEKMTHESKGKFTTGSVENLKTSGVEETESVHSETSGGNIGPPYHRRRQSSNVSDGSKGSAGSTSKMISRNIVTPPLTLAKLRRDTENVGDLKFNYLNKLSSGEENTIFHYVVHNTFHGIIMSPFVNASKGKLHDAVLENFNQACVKIRRHFRRNSSLNESKSCDTQDKHFSSTASDSVTEMGIQFCIADTKRHEPLLKYWVKGRLLLNGGPKEFYVCYQDTAAQNMVELAFKLGFGSPL